MKCNLTESDFQGFRAGVVMTGDPVPVPAMFIESSLDRARLDYVDFRKLDLRPGVTLVDAHIEGADLSGQNLSEINLDGAVLFGANMEEGVFRGASFSDAALTDANLKGADLTGANLLNADIWGVDFKNARLKGANLRGTGFSGIVGKLRLRLRRNRP